MKGLYIHIPFCIKKCKYCDFNSGTASENIMEEYVKALVREMTEYRGAEIDTVYIGGGTPTALKTELLEQVIENIKRNFILSEDTEFTVEMNPKTADREKLKMIYKNGVNRLSIGVQSFRDNELKALGRVHSAEDAKEAITLAKTVGFENISIDLMSGIPEQTEESFLKTLKDAILQEPDHISCYSLILEEGTPLFDEIKSGKITLCDEDTERRLYEIAVDTLNNNGYRQYEISNFAKDGKTSHHNIKYWTMEEYIGLGVSAHSFLNGVRFSNTDNLISYCQNDAKIRSKEGLTMEDMMSEFVFLGLRMTCGISKLEFFKKFEKDIFEVFKKPLEKFINMGFLVCENDRIRLSKEAISVSNQIMCEFLL